MSKNSFVCSRYEGGVCSSYFHPDLSPHFTHLCSPPPPVGTLLLSPLRRHYDPGQKRKKERKRRKHQCVRVQDE